MEHKTENSEQVIFPYFSHSAIMMKLEKLNEMYQDDSLWEIKASGKCFSEKGRKVLESIWNGLFCLGTRFPEDMYWEMEYLNEFIGVVKELCGFQGMNQCFKADDEVRERRKIFSAFLKSLKEHEVYQYHSSGRPTLSILGVIIVQLLKNLTGTKLEEPSLRIDSFVYMTKDEMQKFQSKIDSLIATN